MYRFTISAIAAVVATFTAIAGCTASPATRGKRSVQGELINSPAQVVASSGSGVTSAGRKLSAPPRARAEEMLSPHLAVTPAAKRVVRLIDRLKRSVRVTRYQHWNHIEARKGYYAWDCSGMAMWILRRTARTALFATGKRRPQAVDFYKAIARAPLKRARQGWRRLAHVSAARPGDVFAFPRSKWSRSRTTGHVGFFVERPWPVPGIKNAWAARILDATSVPHQDDTRIDNRDGGFGFGTFMFVTDDAGESIGYGWFGTRSLGYLPTHVVYGRVLR